MHVLDSSGRILRSFGADIDAYRADEPLRHVRVVAPGTDGHIWSAPRGKYLLERWDPSTGRRVAQIAVQSSWFKESARLGSPNERPVPVITALWEVGDTLWVLLRDADTNWRPPEITGERPFELGDYERTFDFVLEAVSITSGVVVATRRFDRALWAREPTFLFATLRQGGAHRTVQVWVPRLVTKERTQ